MLVLYFVIYLVLLAHAKEISWTIELRQGTVKGDKYWDGDYYEFYGIPYATVPKGDDRYKGPLPPKSWDGLFVANETNKYIMCPQLISFDAEPTEQQVVGEEECLVANVFPHSKARSSDKPLPVMVYFHGGAYSRGYGSMVSYQNLLKHEVVVVSFNYRVGALGFLCLGTEAVPGNAGLRDQIKLLKWVKKNIEKFNGDPNNVTIAGFTVGASSAEILMLSGAADGLFNKVICDSGSALSPWAVDFDPINTAKNIAESLGYKGGTDAKLLEEFYLAQSIKSVTAKSAHIWNPNSTFAFAPCVENKVKNVNTILKESPIKILADGNFKKLPVLIGFSNMEGISRLEKIDEWRDMMEENFAKFLPADISLDDEHEESEVINKIKEFYFKGENINEASVQSYVDYFSDAMFNVAILCSAVHHSEYGSPVYLYEFSYVGRLNTPHDHPEINGASHRDQTAYILNFGLAFTRIPSDLETRERMTTMWTNFAKNGKPIPEVTELLDVSWKPYSLEEPNYLSINEDLELKSSPIKERAEFWEKLYDQYYKEPIPPKIEAFKRREKIEL